MAKRSGFPSLEARPCDDPQAVQSYVFNGGFSFPNSARSRQDGCDDNRTLGLPTSYFLDANGLVRYALTGAMSADEMRTKSERLIGKSTLPFNEPSSVTKQAGLANERPVAVIEARTITLADVNRRLDSLLALDRIDSGTVLDPSSEAEEVALGQWRVYALTNPIDETMLADAARTADIKPAIAIDAEMASLADKVGGSDALSGALAKHGVTKDDVRDLFE